MGVHGLWRLIEPSGKPVPLETLENKVLAVDISIWLHQAIKGFQDSKGAPVPNAHLLGIFHRVCKLLYYRIQPVFVFDGSVPVLKRQTIARRNEQKSKNLNDATRLQKQLLNSLLKHSAINAVLSEKAKANLEHDLQKSTKNIRNQNDMYMLPPTQLESTESSSDESSSSTDQSHLSKHWDLHTIDPKSADFKSLPANVRHEILSDLKDTRKQSSWGRIHELPTQSDDFAGYQMYRLLKRYSVQTSLEEAEKEMGGHSLSLKELEALLNNHGVITTTSIVTNRIASDENKRYIYIKDLKQAIEEASNATKDIENVVGVEDDSIQETHDNKEEKLGKSGTDQDFENDLGHAIRLSLQDQATTSKEVPGIDSVEYNDAVEADMSQTSKGEERKATKSLADQEYERDLEEAIKISLQEETKSKNSANTCSSSSAKFNNSITLEEDEGNYSDSSAGLSDFELPEKMLGSAKSYMTEYSGLTPNEIVKILKDNSVKSTRMLNAKLIQNLKRNSSRNYEENTFETSNAKQQTFNKLQTKSICNTTSTSMDDIISSKSDTQPVSEISNVSGTSLQTSNSIKLTLGAKTSKPHSTIENVNVDSVEVMSDSDTSDDFLEVESAKDANLKCTNTEQSLQITIEKEAQLEDDDMFSDIFKDTTNSKDSMKTLSFSQPPRLQNIYKAASNLATVNRNSGTSTQLLETDSIKDTTAENMPTSIEKEDSGMQKNEKQDNADHMLENCGSNPNISSIRDDNQKDSILLKEILKPLGKKVQQESTLTTSELNNMKNALAEESSQLMKEKSVKERLAGNITEQMCQEAQELLQLFGVPYIIAPMEAEAQCAYLNEIGLTDGTITDDSDIWLFGGKTVYKNFFNQSKHVLEFKAENIHQSFKLSRYEMISLALLVGSDYTTGIQGIGPVTALEILAAFPPPKNESTLSFISGLHEFRKWYCSKKISKPARLSLRNKLKNVEISQHFPSLQVVQAYLEPTVETSRDPFSWQKPDIDSLMEYARHKFGWSQKKSEEILKPVLKRMNETSVQPKITNYFKIKHKLQRNDAEDKMSKRVKTAVKKIGTNGSNSDELSEETTKKQPKERTRKPKRKTTKDTVSATMDGVDADATVPKGRKKSTRASKKKTSEDPTSTADNEDIDNDIEILKKTKKLSRGKIKEMKIQMNEMLLRAEAASNPENAAACSSTPHIYRKEIIHQREQQKADLLRNKLKAIEVFRKSRRGPGYVKTRQKAVRQPKEDAELSEESD